MKSHQQPLMQPCIMLHYFELCVNSFKWSGLVLNSLHNLSCPSGFFPFRIYTTLNLWSAELSYSCWNCDIYGFDHVWPESPLDTLTVSFIHDCCFDWTPQCKDCLWFAASNHSRNTRKNTPNIWPGIRGQTHLPYGLMWTTIGGQHWVS